MINDYFTTVGNFGENACPVTAEQWKVIRESPALKELYEKIRNCDDEAMQKELKEGLTWWTPHCSLFRNDRRRKANALRPQRRVTLDLDENKGRSQEICQKALKLKKEKGWQVSLVEESARGGTHVIVEVPEGMTAEHVAKAFCEDLDEQYDTSVLSIEHCLFMTPYTLYIDEELLFRDTFISEDDAKATWPLANGKRKGENRKLSTTAPDCTPETANLCTHLFELSI